MFSVNDYLQKLLSVQCVQDDIVRHLATLGLILGSHECEVS